MKSLLIINFLFLLNTQITAQNLNYIQNKGQWNNKAQFMTNITGGRVFVKNTSLLFDYYDYEQLEEIHHKHDEENHKNDLINCHAYEVTFNNASLVSYIGEGKQDFNYNYFIGDKSNWASNVNLYKTVNGKDLYKNIDIKIYSESDHFKYDFIVHPNGNLNDISLTYKGTNGLSLNEGNLVITTSINQVYEQKPYVYQIINGTKVEVEAEYLLKGNTVSFKIGKYNTAVDLIIDPTLIASTYSGSTETIYGHTATFDTAGNIYSAGAGFSPGGLPVTVGAYQTTYGGNRDMCINKYNPDGSSLIYATYLGGSDDDYPHSLIDFQDKLYVLGTSSSTNFPTTAGAYDQTHNGGSDIVITILDQTGSSLIGSTYMGGSGDDGLNEINDWNTFYANYGDDYRGEIITDASGNAYVSSVTLSSNFPTTIGAFQTTLAGGQDGVVFKLNPTLTTLDFSTFFGGPNDDACYGIKENNSKVYVSGTANSNFVNATGGAFSSYNGQADGFIVAFDATGSTVLHASYFGSSSNDQAFFVEVDRYDEIYILGQTDGTINPTAGVYNGGNGVFIAKFSNDLTSHQYTTTTENMAPVAFLVDDCDYIYASGHGGVSSLSGFDITSNAIQSSSAGFYLMALNPGATSLNFGTYYGSSSSHVDGGTSRFDKKGVVYQATCSSTGFPTTSSAYSTTSASGSWDVTVFKIDFELGAQPAVFGPFPDDEEFTFDVNGCFDVVALGGFAGAQVFLDIQSDAFPLGLYATLPPQKTNGLYDFNYIDTNGSLPITAIDYDVTQHTATTFEGVGNVGARICWNPNECEVLEEDYYNVRLTSLAMRCDSTIDSLVRNLKITVVRDTFNPFVPNVFSPNGDGLNDFYRLPQSQHDRCYDNLNIKIYNRWGVLVFESDDPLFQWDGTNTDGKPLNQGTYYALLEGYFGNKNVSDTFPITLFRD